MNRTPFRNPLPSRTRRTAGVLALVLLCLAGCNRSDPQPPAASMTEALPENPLPPCPASPNCVRETRVYEMPPDVLVARARTALQRIGTPELTASPDERRLDAVYTVVFFKDDVNVAVAPHGDDAVLHIRSASRLGYSDLGVNRRRVKRFFNALEALVRQG